VPAYSQKAYVELNHLQGKYPVTERLANEVLSLPMSPQHTREQILFVCEKVNEFFAA